MFCCKFDRIEEVEVELLTEVCAWVNGRRYSRSNTDWQSFHETWKEAHDCMVAEFSRQIDFAEARLEYSKSKLGKALALKPPVECGDDRNGGGK
jgi:hypothetical protein